jgi:hypothetical protein
VARDDGQADDAPERQGALGVGGDAREGAQELQGQEAICPHQWLALVQLQSPRILPLAGARESHLFLLAEDVLPVRLWAWSPLQTQPLADHVPLYTARY